MICLAACFALLCLVQGLNAEPIQKAVQKRNVPDVCDLTKVKLLDAVLDLLIKIRIPLPVCVDLGALFVHVDDLTAQLEVFLLGAGVVLPVKADVTALVICGKDDKGFRYLSLLIKAFLKIKIIDCGLVSGILALVALLLEGLIANPALLPLLLPALVPLLG